MREAYWKFPKREKNRLLSALKACREIERRGYDCIPEAQIAGRAIEDLLRSEGKERVTYDYAWKWYL